MRKLALFSLLFGYLFASDFITKTEYAKMLYSNPRGIGCDKCHGKKGEGALIAKFRRFDKKLNKVVDDELRAPRINDLDFWTFQKAVVSPKGMMPTYFLTDEEMVLLYEYVINFNKDKKDEK
ncbi:c-type cytochrome [Campylobacter sp. RM16192]|uniref:c-type cytochrome n=1 Tax=Campylobacter sp. RM16192 TaxID=1660080 RepID=UPI0014516167|nr:c-type cytochrome [Campylobacter sp. RM16192]QCD52933.1 periplasmic monoheme cytochrome c [Campylobacter sp. RM16192]